MACGAGMPLAIACLRASAEQAMRPHETLRLGLATGNVISEIRLPWAATLDERLHEGAFGLDSMHQIVSRPLMQ